MTFAVAVALLAGAAPASAQTPPFAPGFMGADISHTGRVDLVVVGPPGATATYYERIGDRRVELGRRPVTQFGGSLLQRATSWRCDRVVRRFEADVIGLDGSRFPGAFAVRTPSCRDRFTLSLPDRVAPGRLVSVGVRDTWGLGAVNPRVCVGAPGARARCHTVALRPGQATARKRFRATRAGLWKVRLRLASARPLRSLRVGAGRGAGPPAPAPLVLATGDSTIQGVDGFLADRLGARGRVVGRLRPGTGISKPDPQSWLKAARIQSSTLKPNATVVSVGVNDGFAMTTPGGGLVECCGEAWVTEYARRARIMMRTWMRFGGRVAWMTLPAPGVGDLVTQFAAVNTAVSRAASGLPRVTLARIDLLLSPNGYHVPFRIRNGRRVGMYLGDGLHLSPAGTSIAADAVATQLRRSGALARRR